MTTRYKVDRKGVATLSLNVSDSLDPEYFLVTTTDPRIAIAKTPAWHTDPNWYCKQHAHHMLHKFDEVARSKVVAANTNATPARETPAANAPLPGHNCPCSASAPAARGPLAKSAARLLALIESAMHASGKRKTVSLSREDAEECFAIADELASKLTDE